MLMVLAAAGTDVPNDSGCPFWPSWLCITHFDLLQLMLKNNSYSGEFFDFIFRSLGKISSIERNFSVSLEVVLLI